MKVMNNNEKAILKAAEGQLTYAITAAHHTRNSNLIGARAAVKTTKAPEGAPDINGLNDILNIGDKAPGNTTIVSVPEGKPDDIPAYMLQLLSQVQTLESYISLLTAYCVYNEHPEPYNIQNPAEASAFTKATAKWRNYVMTGGAVKAMAGYIPVSKITTQNYSSKVAVANFHPEFLGVLFGAFAFPEAAALELEGILTGVVSKLDNLNLSFSEEKETLDHFLTYFYFTNVPGTGGESGIPAVKIAKVRTFYLNIDQASYKAAIGKNKVEYLSFNMTYYDMDTTMSSQLVASDSAAIDSAIKTLTGQSAADVKKTMNIKAVHSQREPSFA